MDAQHTDVDASTATSEPPAWLAGLKEDFHAVFVEHWSPYIGALLLVAIALGLAMNGLFWGVFGGIKLWGDWIFSLAGLGSLLGISGELANPLTHRISLMNITLVLGSFTAAALAGDFRIAPARKLDYAWGAVGGTFMGVGASLAGGCTVGGLFSPALFSAASAWVMLVGLTIGAIVGLKVLFWSMGRITWGMTPPKASASGTFFARHNIKLGVLVALGVAAWFAAWRFSGDAKVGDRALVIAAGFALGFVLHRSRFCFARAVREPFMTGDGTMTKAVLLGFVVGIPLMGFLIGREVIDPYVATPARFWLGSLAGGIVFGFGMVFASGCASGSLWRLGEGQLKLAVAVLFFALSGSLFNALVKPFGLLTAEMSLDLVEATPLGYQAHLPAMLGGWTGTYAFTFAALALWYAFVRYNESTERFTVV